MAEAIRMNPLPAPHPVLPAAAFPRVHAENFPHGDREAYAKYYPYGIPVTYKMMHGVHSQGVAQTYLEDNLPIGFYTNIPPKATAIISTSNGSRPFRKLDQIIPQRRIHLWSKDEIQAICNSLRKLHWDELKNMQQPYCWDDLWAYFDAYDLYHNGCLNLWNVINTIWDENKLISIDVRREIAAHIGHWADEWLKLEKNRDKLLQWKESQGSIYRILDDEDHESLGSLQDDVVPLIASALKGRRAYLLSNMEAEKAEEPADLITAFRTNGVENWLTGQPIFDCNGLPPPPVSEPHRLSNDPAPCFEQDGKHYFLPPNFFPPEESFQNSVNDFQALHNSPELVSSPAESPKSGVVIVNGSNIPKLSQGPINRAYQQKIDELQSQNATQRTTSMPETSSPTIFGGNQELGRGRSPLAVDDEATASADVRRSSEPAALTITGQNLSDNPSCLKKEGSEAMMDNSMKEITGKRQAEQEATHFRQSNDPEVEGPFPMHDTARFDQRQAPGAVTNLVDSTAPKQLPPTQRARRLSQEQRKPIDFLPGDSFKQSLNPSSLPSAEPAAFYMQPEKGGMQHHVGPRGFPYQSQQFNSAPNKPIPHNMPYREFSGAQQGMSPHQFPMGTHSHAIPSTVPYNTPANGSDDSIHLAQQPRQEYLYASSMPSAHNGYQNSDRPYYYNNNNNNNNRVGHRRGSQSQKTHGYVPGQQPQTEHNAAFQESHLNKSWRRGPQHDRARQSSWCRNAVGSNIEYCHCTCDQCNERNRSVWVRVISPESFVSIMEILSFLKFGLSTRFGKVEEAYPAPSMRRDAFIVRFESESSVSQALAFGGGMVPEKDVRITIQPVHRSKWMKRHPQQHPRKLPPLPITHQQPSQGESLSPSKSLVHVQAPTSCSLGSSHTSTPEPDQHEIPSRPTSVSTLPQAVLSSQSMEQQTISPTTESNWDAKSDKVPTPTEVPAANRKHFASEELREYAADPSSLPLQAMNYQKAEKFEKEDFPYLESLSEEVVVEKGIRRCDITTVHCDSSKCLSPEKVDSTLPSTPINSVCSSNDTPKAKFSNNLCPNTGADTPMPKSNNGKAKQSSSIVMEDCQLQSSGVIGKVENAARVKENSDNEAIRAPSDLRKAQNPTTNIERPPLTAVVSSEKHIESSMKGHSQAFGYTEKEIKERKQAWNRIPMPLDPRKSKKLGTIITSSQQSSLPILGASSNNTTEKADIAKPHIGKRDQLESIHTPQLDKVNLEHLTKTAEVSIKDKTHNLTEEKSLDYELKSGTLAQLPRVPLANEVSTNMTTTGEPQASKMKTSGSYQTASENTGAAASHFQPPAGENKTNNTGNSQTKPRPKWNKPKKSKKRLALASQIVLQNEDSSQEISPSVSETPSMLKEELRADYHMFTSAPAISESPPHPVHFTGKPDEHATELFKGSIEQAMTNNRSQYSYDTLPRGRHDFRNNAGGSLRVPKKRKNKYPAITSKTFEVSPTIRFEPTEPEYSESGQMPMRNIDNINRLDPATQITEPDSSKRSRLNPLATAFESPQKATVAAVDIDKTHNLCKAGPRRIGEGEELPRENRSPSKFRIIPRSTTTHESPTKSQHPKEKLVRRIDSSKMSGGLEISTRQRENNPSEIQRSWSKDKHGNDSEIREPINSKATSPGRKAALDKKDWPSLPASCIRSATLQ
ncbi:hypothetical protein LI328DRAFT_172040 [Trichoderma asperelloides]|nr:hypothetical protein LI328DRAFT_172040 [Trichoderma asperelloides]